MKILAWGLLLASCSAFPAHAASAGGMFEQGRTFFMLEAGSGTAYNNSYLILGLGVNYYVADGLGVGLSYENWSGGSPGLNQIAPSVQYVFYQASTIKPYVGAFYRHTSVSGQSGFNSAGARAGVYFASSRHSAIGVGLVEESYLNCQKAAFGTCSQSYPELSILVAF